MLNTQYISDIFHWNTWINRKKFSLFLFIKMYPSCLTVPSMQALCLAPARPTLHRDGFYWKKKQFSTRTQTNINGHIYSLSVMHKCSIPAGLMVFTSSVCWGWRSCAVKWEKKSSSMTTHQNSNEHKWLSVNQTWGISSYAYRITLIQQKHGSTLQLQMLGCLCHQSIQSYKWHPKQLLYSNIRIYEVTVRGDLSNHDLMCTFAKQYLKSFMFWIDFTCPDKVLILILPWNVQICSTCLSISNDHPTENNFALWVVKSSLM